MENELISRPNVKALRLYVRYMVRYPRFLALGSLFSLMLSLRITFVPLLVTMLLGQYTKHHVVDVSLLIFTGAFQVVILLLSYLTDHFGVALLHDSVEEQLYQDSFNYFTRQDYSFFTNNFSGSLVTQASRFAKSYTTFNDVIFFEVLPRLLSLLFVIVVIAHYSLWLALVILIIWLFAVWAIIKFALLRLPIRRRAVAKESESVGELADMITNALTVKTFAAEEREQERYSKVNKIRGRLFLISWRRAVRNAWLVQAICVALQMIVLASGLVLLQRGTITIPVFLLFQVYIFRIVNDIGESVFIARQFEVVSGDAQEMAELLEQTPLVQDIPNAKEVQIKKGKIDLRKINFQYQDAGRKSGNLFKDFSLNIKSGERVGLVGPSGGGKTTITRLLLRFMDIQSGQILIDDQDIATITQRSLRSAIAYVPQEPLLFHRTIKENIRYGKPSATDEEIRAVAKKSHADEFIKDLPQGYDTIVGERGVKLSGGQRQRVAIARAMLADAPILILDEATSALDSESERVIQAALWELMKDKTAVVIAHRLSTIQRLDRIVVLDGGKVAEDGTHKTLLKKNGLYARLWKHQSGGFLES